MCRILLFFLQDAQEGTACAERAGDAAHGGGGAARGRGGHTARESTNSLGLGVMERVSHTRPHAQNVLAMLPMGAAALCAGEVATLCARAPI